MTHVLRREIRHVIAGILLTASIGASSQESASSLGADSVETAAANQARAIPDSKGRISYRIQLAPARNGDESSMRQQESIAGQYGFTIESSALDGGTFAASLDEDQEGALRSDPRVLSVGTTMSGPNSDGVWTDGGGAVTGTNSTTAGPYANRVTQTTEVVPWGKKAMNQAATASNGNAVVYVLDYGIAPHADLNVVEWVLPNDTSKHCGTRIGVTCTPAMMQSLVGCYAHATAVAGIVGAKVNGTGTQGIDPNVKIVSVSYMPSVTSGTCNGATTRDDYITTALNWIKQDIQDNNHTGRPSVVNVSIGWETGTSPISNPAFSNWVAAMKDLATPAPGYPGAFITQSAGNQFDVACNHAYSAPTGVDGTSDGIMVVSAINSYGQPIVPLNGMSGFWKNPVEGPKRMGPDRGSNFGTCVEAWAPGDAVFTTVGPIGTQSGSPPSPYNTYAYVSGTSFSAPHVAGLAAHLIETQNLTTPGGVEQKIRQLAAADLLGSRAPSTSAFPPNMINFHSANGVQISLPTLNPLAAGIPRNKPYAEIDIASACIYPLFQGGTAPAGCTKFNYVATPVYPLVLQGGSYVIDPALVVNGWNRSWTSNSTWITFDSYGMGSYSCDVWMRDFSGNPNTTILTGKYGYLPAYSTPGFRQYGSTACPSLSASFYM